MKIKTVRRGGAERFSPAGTGAPDAIDSNQGSVSDAPAARSNVLRVIDFDMPTSLSLPRTCLAGEACGLIRICTQIALRCDVEHVLGRETRGNWGERLIGSLTG